MKYCDKKQSESMVYTINHDNDIQYREIDNQNTSEYIISFMFSV